MAAPTLLDIGSFAGAYLRTNRGGGRSNPDQGNNLLGLQRLGIVKSTAGETYYLYYNPATHVIAYSSSTPVDTGLEG